MVKAAVSETSQLGAENHLRVVSNACVLSSWPRKEWTIATSRSTDRGPAAIPKAHPSICSYFFSCQDQTKKLTKHNSFLSEMEDMRKAFLMRPGCPQFSTRTTSVSHVGKTSPDLYHQE